MRQSDRKDEMARFPLRATVLGLAIRSRRGAKKGLFAFKKGLFATLACLAVAFGLISSIMVGALLFSLAFLGVFVTGLYALRLLGIGSFPPGVGWFMQTPALALSLGAAPLVICAMGLGFKERPLSEEGFSLDQRNMASVNNLWIRKRVIVLMRANNAICDGFFGSLARAQLSGWALRPTAVSAALGGLLPAAAAALGFVGGAAAALGVIYAIIHGAGRLVLYPVKALLAQRPAQVQAKISAGLLSAKAWAQGKAEEIAQEGASSRAFALAEKRDLEKAASEAKGQSFPPKGRL